MKAPRFDYRAPDTLAEALDILADPELDVVVLAGGQSLMPLLNARIVRPQVVLDINHIQALDGIGVDPAGARIGAMTRLAAVEHHRGLAEVLPVLREGLLYVAHPQIRNRGTFGGTLSYAEPAAETPMMCLALDARFALVSTSGERVVAADDFFHSRGVTARSPHELLVAGDIPVPVDFQFRFSEFARREHGDFPYVSVCVGVRHAGGQIVDARMAASGVAERPIRLRAAEEALIGRRLDEDLGEILAVACEGTRPPSDDRGSAEFRRGVLRTLLRKTLTSIDHRTVPA